MVQPGGTTWREGGGLQWRHQRETAVSELTEMCTKQNKTGEMARPTEFNWIYIYTFYFILFIQILQAKMGINRKV